MYAFSSFENLPRRLAKAPGQSFLARRIRWRARARSAAQPRGCMAGQFEKFALIFKARKAGLDKATYWNRNMGARLPGPPCFRYVVELVVQFQETPSTMSRTKLFSRQAWDKNASIYEVIRTMPFNAQLASGTLSAARFKHYITQDAHYLIGFGRALTLAAAKAPNPDRIVQFAKAAEGALVVERALHGSFFKQYGITPRAFAQTPLSPACHHYISYLLATAYAEPYEVLLGALLPCFWIYAEVGRDIHARARAANRHP
jgi:thiaminase